MIRLIRQWAAKRRLAQLRKANIARMSIGIPRDRLGRFTTKGKLA